MGQARLTPGVGDAKMNTAVKDYFADKEKLSLPKIIGAGDKDIVDGKQVAGFSWPVKGYVQEAVKAPAAVRMKAVETEKAAPVPLVHPKGDLVRAALRHMLREVQGTKGRPAAKVLKEIKGMEELLATDGKEDTAKFEKAAKKCSESLKELAGKVPSLLTEKGATPAKESPEKVQDVFQSLAQAREELKAVVKAFAQQQEGYSNKLSTLTQQKGMQLSAAANAEQKAKGAAAEKMSESASSSDSAQDEARMAAAPVSRAAQVLPEMGNPISGESSEEQDAEPQPDLITSQYQRRRLLQVGEGKVDDAGPMNAAADASRDAAARFDDKIEDEQSAFGRIEAEHKEAVAALRKKIKDLQSRLVDAASAAADGDVAAMARMRDSDSARAVADAYERKSAACMHQQKVYAKRVADREGLQGEVEELHDMITGTLAASSKVHMHKLPPSTQAALKLAQKKERKAAIFAVHAHLLNGQAELRVNAGGADGPAFTGSTGATGSASSTGATGASGTGMSGPAAGATGATGTNGEHGDSEEQIKRAKSIALAIRRAAAQVAVTAERHAKLSTTLARDMTKEVMNARLNLAKVTAQTKLELHKQHAIVEKAEAAIAAKSREQELKQVLRMKLDAAMHEAMHAKANTKSTEAASAQRAHAAAVLAASQQSVFKSEERRVAAHEASLAAKTGLEKALSEAGATALRMKRLTETVDKLRKRASKFLEALDSANEAAKSAAETFASKPSAEAREKSNTARVFADEAKQAATMANVVLDEQDSMLKKLKVDADHLAADVASKREVVQEAAKAQARADELSDTEERAAIARATVASAAVTGAEEQIAADKHAAAIRMKALAGVVKAQLGEARVAAEEAQKDAMREREGAAETNGQRLALKLAKDQTDHATKLGMFLAKISKMAEDAAMAAAEQDRQNAQKKSEREGLAAALVRKAVSAAAETAELKAKASEAMVSKVQAAKASASAEEASSDAKAAMAEAIAKEGKVDGVRIILAGEKERLRFFIAYQRKGDEKDAGKIKVLRAKIKALELELSAAVRESVQARSAASELQIQSVDSMKKASLEESHEEVSEEREGEAKNTVQSKAADELKEGVKAETKAAREGSNAAKSAKAAYESAAAEARRLEAKMAVLMDRIFEAMRAKQKADADGEGMESDPALAEDVKEEVGQVTSTLESRWKKLVTMRPKVEAAVVEAAKKLAAANIESSSSEMMSIDAKEAGKEADEAADEEKVVVEKARQQKAKEEENQAKLHAAADIAAGASGAAEGVVASGESAISGPSGASGASSAPASTGGESVTGDAASGPASSSATAATATFASGATAATDVLRENKQSEEELDADLPLSSQEAADAEQKSMETEEEKKAVERMDASEDARIDAEAKAQSEMDAADAAVKGMESGDAAIARNQREKIIKDMNEQKEKVTAEEDKQEGEEKTQLSSLDAVIVKLKEHGNLLATQIDNLRKSVDEHKKEFISANNKFTEESGEPEIEDIEATPASATGSADGENVEDEEQAALLAERKELLGLYSKVSKATIIGDKVVFRTARNAALSKLESSVAHLESLLNEEKSVRVSLAKAEKLHSSLSSKMSRVANMTNDAIAANNVAANASKAEISARSLALKADAKVKQLQKDISIEKEERRTKLAEKEMAKAKDTAAMYALAEERKAQKNQMQEFLNAANSDSEKARVAGAEAVAFESKVSIAKKKLAEAEASLAAAKDVLANADNQVRESESKHDKLQSVVTNEFGFSMSGMTGSIGASAASAASGASGATGIAGNARFEKMAEDATGPTGAAAGSSGYNKKLMANEIGARKLKEQIDQELEKDRAGIDLAVDNLRTETKKDLDAKADAEEKLKFSADAKKKVQNSRAAVALVTKKQHAKAKNHLEEAIEQVEVSVARLRKVKEENKVISDKIDSLEGSIREAKRGRMVAKEEEIVSKKKFIKAVGKTAEVAQNNAQVLKRFAVIANRSFSLLQLGDEPQDTEVEIAAMLKLRGEMREAEKKQEDIAAAASVARVNTAGKITELNVVEKRVANDATLAKEDEAFARQQGHEEAASDATTEIVADQKELGKVRADLQIAQEHAQTAIVDERKEIAALDALKIKNNDAYERASSNARKKLQKRLMARFLAAKHKQGIADKAHDDSRRKYADAKQRVVDLIDALATARDNSKLAVEALDKAKESLAKHRAILVVTQPFEASLKHLMEVWSMPGKYEDSAPLEDPLAAFPSGGVTGGTGATGSASDAIDSAVRSASLSEAARTVLAKATKLFQSAEASLLKARDAKDAAVKKEEMDIKRREEAQDALNSAAEAAQNMQESRAKAFEDSEAAAKARAHAEEVDADAKADFKKEDAWVQAALEHLHESESAHAKYAQQLSTLSQDAKSKRAAAAKIETNIAAQAKELAEEKDEDEIMSETGLDGEEDHLEAMTARLKNLISKADAIALDAESSSSFAKKVTQIARQKEDTKKEDAKALKEFEDEAASLIKHERKQDNETDFERSTGASGAEFQMPQAVEDLRKAVARARKVKNELEADRKAVEQMRLEAVKSKVKASHERLEQAIVAMEKSKSEIEPLKVALHDAKGAQKIALETLQLANKHTAEMKQKLNADEIARASMDRRRGDGDVSTEPSATSSSGSSGPASSGATGLNVVKSDKTEGASAGTGPGSATDYLTELNTAEAASEVVEAEAAFKIQLAEHAKAKKAYLEASGKVADFQAKKTSWVEDIARKEEVVGRLEGEDKTMRRAAMRLVPSLELTGVTGTSGPSGASASSGSSGATGASLSEGEADLMLDTTFKPTGPRGAELDSAIKKMKEDGVNLVKVEDVVRTNAVSLREAALIHARNAGKMESEEEAKNLDEYSQQVLSDAAAAQEASVVLHEQENRMNGLLSNASKAQRTAEDVVSLMHVKEIRNASALKVENAEKMEEETAARDKELKKAARKQIFELGKLSEANLALANKAAEKLKEAHGMEAERTKAKLALEKKLSGLRVAERKLATAKEVLNRFMGEKLTQFEDWLSGGAHTDQKAEAEAHDMVKHAREMHERAHQAEVATQASALAVKRLSEQASVAHDLAHSAAKEAEEVCETARKAKESSSQVGSFDQWLAGSPVSKDQLAEAQLHCKEAKAEAARKQDAQKVAADAEAKAWKQLEAGKSQAAASGETAKSTLAKAMKYVKFARKRSADENAAWEDAKKEAQRRVKSAMEVVDHADSAVSEARTKLEQIKSAIQKLIDEAQNTKAQTEANTEAALALRAHKNETQGKALAADAAHREAANALVQAEAEAVTARDNELRALDELKEVHQGVPLAQLLAAKRLKARKAFAEVRSIVANISTDLEPIEKIDANSTNDMTKVKRNVVEAKVHKAQRLQAVAADMASVLKETAAALSTAQRGGSVGCEGSLAQCAANRAKLEAVEASKEASAAVFDTRGEKDASGEAAKSHDVAIEAIREMENNTQVTPKKKVIRLMLGDDLDNVTNSNATEGKANVNNTFVNITASLPTKAKEAMEKAGKEVSELDAKAEQKIEEVTEQLDSQRSRSDIEDAQIAESQEAKKQAEDADAEKEARDESKSDNATAVMRRLKGDESPITATGVNATEVEDAIRGKSAIISGADKAAGQKQTNGTQANKEQAEQAAKKHEAEKEEKAALEEAKKDKEMVDIAKEEVAEAEKSGNKAEVETARKEMVAAIKKEGEALDKAKESEKEVKEASEKALAAGEGASAASGASGASDAAASGPGQVPTEDSVNKAVDKAMGGPAACMPVGAPDRSEGSVTTFGGNSCLADLTYSDAVALCASHKAHVCSHNELKQSLLAGHSSCTCGWTSTAASGDKFLVESVMASSGGCGGAATRGITICDEAARSKTFGVHCCSD
jgi:hypothetical protein